MIVKDVVSNSSCCQERMMNLQEKKWNTRSNMKNINGWQKRNGYETNGSVNGELIFLFSCCVVITKLSNSSCSSILLILHSDDSDDDNDEDKDEEEAEEEEDEDESEINRSLLLSPIPPHFLWRECCNIAGVIQCNCMSQLLELFPLK